MKSKKAAIGLFGLILIGLAMFAVLYLIQSGWIQKFINIKSQADIFLNVIDKTSGLVTILKTKTDDFGQMDSIACEYESLRACVKDQKISAMADSIDTKIMIYDENGDVKKAYGKRSLGKIMRAEIPLPGGRSAFIGIVTDMEGD